MDLTSHIGIAVSGCKNGYALLATDGIDSSSELLHTALRDLRSYLRVTEPGHNYFTLGVYRGTLVISACRSSVDAVGSSGGFIAVSLTVPPSLSIKRPADLLSALLDEYWNEFMHPMFGSPLPGKFESAHRLRALLQSRAADVTPARVRYRIFDFEAAKPPLFMDYKSLAEVNAVMSTPWHHVYSRGCKLIMLPDGMLSSPKVNYNIEVKKIAPQHGAPGTAIDVLLPPQDCPVTLSSYAVNAMPCRSMGDASLKSDDIISYTLSLPDGKNLPFNGTLRQAKERGLISRDGDNFRIIPPVMDVTLSITGARPAQGCEYVLKSARGDVFRGRPVASNPLQRVFRIKCADFPYSLAEEQEGSAKRTLCPNVVTKDNLRQQPIAVTVAAAKKTSGFGGFGGFGGGKGYKESYPTDPVNSRKHRLPLPLIVAIAALFVGLAGLGVWWLWPSEQEEIPYKPSGIIYPPTPNPKPQPLPEPQDPKYTYLFIPVETLCEGMTKSSYDHPSSQAFPAGTDYHYDKTTEITIIRIPEQEGLRLDLGIHLEGAMKEDCGYLQLNPTNMPGYNDLVNYLTSDNNRLLVRPADPNKQPSSELLQSIKTIDLDNLTYVPLDTTPPTGANKVTPDPKPGTTGGGAVHNRGGGGGTGGSTGSGTGSGGEALTPSTLGKDS